VPISEFDFQEIFTSITVALERDRTPFRNMFEPPHVQKRLSAQHEAECAQIRALSGGAETKRKALVALKKALAIAKVT
jgi:hypothetical protein